MPVVKSISNNADYLDAKREIQARVGFKCRSILAKLREIYMRLIEYHCYEYCQIGHHILIDNRLDDFYPRMLAWQTTRRKFTGNKVKHHLALMRQQLDLRTINNIQWDPFRNIKDALKRHVSHGALMSDIARCGNIDIPGPGALTGGVTFLHVEFPTTNFFTQETQIPTPQFGIEVEWEDDEGEAGTSQAWTSNVRGSRGRTYEGGAALPRRSRRTR
ncbi:hypothetical protein GIB67_017553 [Kingdonia uniflora]|uniref:Uncharacterized protein n=1 Tax=Kingdonia uniflora TaxID=39325 RepID=A0A7J7N4G6_9MAGN|nr:hypothetical protein GIB67_017553 [Kingdonia uniflora]